MIHHVKDEADTKKIAKYVLESPELHSYTLLSSVSL